MKRGQEQTRKQGRNEYIKAKAVEVGRVGGHEYWVVPCRMAEAGASFPCGFNGYVVFKRRPTVETGYGGILRYVPVHGGITYAVQDGLGMVYGFDTAHFDSGKFPIHDKAWIKGQCAVMVRAIRLAAKLEKQYRLASTNEEKATICDQVCAVQRGQQLNMGTMLAVLTGDM